MESKRPHEAGQRVGKSRCYQFLEVHKVGDGEVSTVDQLRWQL
jgi:hypothetical protein